MTLKELKEMINLMEEHSLSEIEIEKEGLKIKLKRGPSEKVVSEQVIPQIQMAPIPVHAPAPSGQQMARETADDANTIVVRSPMVGTFYTAPAPDAAPYAVKGKSVKEGDVLCIIEAMKLMNEIKSDVNGMIQEVLVENGQPVEFDQPLFKVQKA